MTAITTQSGTTTDRSLPLGVAGVLASAACTAVGTFLDLTGNESGSGYDLGEYLIVLGMVAVTAAVVFGLVVRTAGRGNPSRRAAILGVVSFLSIAFFWAGLPMVLAAGTLACALIDRDKVGAMGTGSKVGVVLAALTTAAAVGLAIAG